MCYVATSLTYDASPELHGYFKKGIAYGCTKYTATNCAGHTLLFEAIARANGIPCRRLVGQRCYPDRNAPECTALRSAKGLSQEDLVSYPHARIEFYADGIGWIPVEAVDKDKPYGRTFGIDPSIPFCTKNFDTESCIEFPHSRSTTTGKSPTYSTISAVKQGAKTTFLDWEITVHKI